LNTQLRKNRAVYFIYNFNLTIEGSNMKRSNWKMKAIVLASLISFVVVPCYPSLSLAQEAAPVQAAPQAIELAQAAGGAGVGAGAAGAGAGATATLAPAIVYGIAVGALVLGAGIANSINAGDNTTAHHTTAQH
jgi:hypothetical protein